MSSTFEARRSGLRVSRFRLRVWETFFHVVYIRSQPVDAPVALLQLHLVRTQRVLESRHLRTSPPSEPCARFVSRLRLTPASQCWLGGRGLTSSRRPDSRASSAAWKAAILRCSSAETASLLSMAVRRVDTSSVKIRLSSASRLFSSCAPECTLVAQHADIAAALTGAQQGFSRSGIGCRAAVCTCLQQKRYLQAFCGLALLVELLR
jgi:hypothetical protein